MPDKAALYIHIPFCHKKCHYCAFVKTIWSKETEHLFAEALCKELSAYAHHFPKLVISTVFVGGGTPSSLSPSVLDQIFTHAFSLFRTTPHCEKTLEANPESVSRDRLLILKKHGFNRISMGVQSFDTDELKQLGRWHHNSHVEKAVALLKETGFYNFNLDFIFGLPHASLDTLEATLTKAISLSPTHLSTYALTIEPKTVFSKKRQPILPSDEAWAHYRFIRRFLPQHGYKHYEVSAFAKPGFRCRHNLAYWNLTPFIGLGPSGASFFENRHYQNTEDIMAYIQDPTPPLFRKRKPPVMSRSHQIQDFMVANLRRIDGIRFSAFQARFGQDCKLLFGPVLEKLHQAKLIRITDTHLKVSAKGLDILDSVLLELLSYDCF